MKKRGVLFILSIIILSAFASAGWVVDFNEDDCVGLSDIGSVITHLGATGTNKYDVNGDRIVDEKDVAIVQDYVDRGEQKGDCNGFNCVAEDCNLDDDDCDGVVDEDTNEEMCGGTLSCINGNCVLIAGACVDSDGYDIYKNGNSIGETEEGFKINQDESCYEVDIFNQLKETQECYGEKCFLLEYECSESDTLIEEKVNCEFGCRYGKCRNIIKRCIEEDDGLDIFELSDGSFEEDNGSKTELIDFCKDTNNDGVSDTLVEYECLGEYNPDTKTLNEEYKTWEVICTCEDGICKNVVDGSCVDTDGNDMYTKGYTDGTLAETGELNDFDYCMIKTGQSFEKTDKCSGELCHLNEYACNHKKAVIKYVHECPLGCVDGFCIGTECSKDESFILNEGRVLGYDDKCEYIQKTADDELDLPSDNFNILKDFSCCSGSAEAYCVYNGKCYSSSRSSNFYEINGETVVCGCTDSTCSFSDGNHVGLWYDLDSDKGICEGGTDTCNIKWYPETGFKWIIPGITKTQEENIWEYEDSVAECCGDDDGEYVICQEQNCICCDEETASYDNGKCGKSTTTQETTIPEVSKEPEKEEQTQEDIEPIQELTESQTTATYSKKLIIIPVVFAIIGALVMIVFSKKNKIVEIDKNFKKKEVKEK